MFKFIGMFVGMFVFKFMAVLRFVDYMECTGNFEPKLGSNKAGLLFQNAGKT